MRPCDLVAAAIGVISAMDADDSLSYCAFDYGEDARPLCKASLAKVLASSTLYLQHGFGYEEGHDDTNKDGPIRRVLKETLEPSWEEPLMEWITERPWFEMTNSDVTRHCLVNGAFSPVTLTHFDPYLNVALVLQGKKTFWCARGSQSQRVPALSRRGSRRVVPESTRRRTRFKPARWKHPTVRQCHPTLYQIRGERR